jgi:hypothetical protein
MNAHTLGLLMTMSDANGRPIMTSTPGDAVPFRVNGAPVVIATQMPDVAPGALPIAYGNWKQAYMVVNRRGVTVHNEAFSPAGAIFSNLMRASAASSFVRTLRGCCAFAEPGPARACPSRGRREEASASSRGGRLFRRCRLAVASRSSAKDAAVRFSNDFYAGSVQRDDRVAKQTHSIVFMSLLRATERREKL